MNSSQRDLEILRDGPICLYHNSGMLNKDCSWFSDNNFELIDINCGTWTKNNIHSKIKEALFFPDYYGENLAAFYDCLSDMYNTKYRGLVLIFRSFDHVVAEKRNLAEGILDAIALTSREWLIEGHKLICLIQSSDPDLELPKLGGLHPVWNNEEWLNANRRKGNV